MLWPKKIILRFFLLCSMIIVLIFFVLGTDSRLIDSYQDSEDELIESIFLNAKIIEIEEDFMLVEPIYKYKEYSEILVYMSKNDSERVLKKGDLVRIEYNGSIHETVPPSMTALQIEKR